MEVTTSIPVMTNATKIIANIAKFWDKTSLGWREIWGQHIHHGYYENGEDQYSLTAAAAQENLLDKLCILLKPQAGDLLLDVGCGMGGSSIYLTKNYNAKVTGISLSITQLKIAREATKTQELSVTYKYDDAHYLANFEDNTFDIVWALESCEQFYDKALFIKQAFRVLKPGGKLLLATWCADREKYSGIAAKHYVSLCKGFDLPYMPTMTYYQQLLEKHFAVTVMQDWSDNVKNSWEYGINKLKNFSFWKLFTIGGLTGVKLVSKLKLMSCAFKSGQIRYGVFIAIKE
jgi:tocopherol O-methyltransferase